MLLKKNQAIHYNNYAKDLGIITNNNYKYGFVFVSENQIDEKQEKIKVSINFNHNYQEVDIDKLITLMLPTQKEIDKINTQIENLLSGKFENYIRYSEELNPEDRTNKIYCYACELTYILKDYFCSAFSEVTLLPYVHPRFSVLLETYNKKMLRLELQWNGSWFDYYDIFADSRSLNVTFQYWKPLPKNIEEIADIINEQNGQIDWRNWICYK